jgi:DNA-binding transcriptional LysR family regulator
MASTPTVRQADWDSQVGRRLKLRHLHIFSEVIRCGSMAKAAAELRVAQPTVSEVIAELEHTFGVRLLDRSPQGVAPTVYGDALLKRSIAAFDELKQSSRDIEYLADPTVGDLRIGSPDSISTAVLLPTIDRFSKLHPRVVLHFEDLPSPAAQRAALRERQCDLVIARRVHPPLDAEEDLNVEVLFNDRLLVVASGTNRWARRRSIELAELVNEPWLLAGRETWTYSQLSAAFRARGLDIPKASLVTRSVPLRVHLLANGQYITEFSHLTFRLYAERHDLKVLPVNLPERPWPLVIATLKHRTLSPLVERFIACAREVAKSFPAPPGAGKRSNPRANSAAPGR